jgi:hypothetical protein
LQVLNEAAAKQAELSAQAQTITNIMNQLIAGHANFSKHLGSKQSELKTLLEPGALAAAAAAEATTATAAGGASSMGSLEDLQQYKQRQLLQGALHDAGPVSGSQVSTASVQAVHIGLVTYHDQRGWGCSPAMV